VRAPGSKVTLAPVIALDRRAWIKSIGENRASEVVRRSLPDGCEPRRLIYIVAFLAFIPPTASAASCQGSTTSFEGAEMAAKHVQLDEL
jgi:hypothetical protein